MAPEKPILDNITYNDTMPNLLITRGFGQLPWHYHPHVEFVYMLEGEAVLEVEDERRCLRKGDSALIFPHTPHRFLPSDRPRERFMAVFDPRYYGELTDIFLRGEPKNWYFTAEQTAAILPSDRQGFANLCNIWPRRGVLETAERCARFAVILTQLLRLCGLADVQSDQTLYRAAIAYCAENFHNPALLVEDVARALNVSRSKLNALFSEKHGGIKAYINLCRIRQAEMLLKNGDASIAQVAAESGFSEIRTFNRAFKKHHGITPLAYRKAQ